MLKALVGDTVVDDSREIGIIEGRNRNVLTVRYPGRGNVRFKKTRDQVQHLAERIRQARLEGRPLQVGGYISLVGDSRLVDLVGLFGHPTSQFRRDSLAKVLKQLRRAGLEITTYTGNWARDDHFRIDPLVDADVVDQVEDVTEEPAAEAGRAATSVELPDPFWPTAFGLEAGREMDFLRSLTGSEPLLCLLYLPDQAGPHAWVQAVWEGLVGWAFHAAQRFVRRPGSGDDRQEVLIGPETLLGAYIRPSALDPESLRLRDRPHSLNLIAIKRASEPPVHLRHLHAVWPGPIFEFRPEYGHAAAPSADMRSICACLSLVGGLAPTGGDVTTPLGMLTWARVAHRQLAAMPIARFGEVLSTKRIERFKGSNECAATLALKAHLAHWIASILPAAELNFECADSDEKDEDAELNLEARPIRRRVDLSDEGLGEFEVESLLGSGPMESFYHKKIFSRQRAGRANRFWLVVPNDALLWAGPHLGDLAHHLGDGGHVIVPSLDGGFLEIAGRPLASAGAGAMRPEESEGPAETAADLAESPLKLDDVAGYADIRGQIKDLIIWPERHRAKLRGLSRSSGILFFGPPGCGKTRWARAIAGELEQEVRLLGPSDLRGPFIGWGQVKIREQFDWLAEGESRMLIIDELDGVAHSRRERQMHTDDKASVNELLVQVDRVLRLGRLLAATTNFIGSLDEALTRSGRFGRFIPVAPPDLGEAAQIVGFYLKALSAAAGADGTAAVSVPDTGRVRAILEPLYAQGLAEGRFFCGADLEAAVNGAYIRSVQAAIPTDGWAHGTVEDVILTEEVLAETLAAAPRSVQPDAVERFLSDVDRYCGRDVATPIRLRLSPAAVGDLGGRPDESEKCRRIGKRMPGQIARRWQSVPRTCSRPNPSNSTGPPAPETPVGDSAAAAWGPGDSMWSSRTGSDFMDSSKGAQES